MADEADNLLAILGGGLGGAKLHNMRGNADFKSLTEVVRMNVSDNNATNNKVKPIYDRLKEIEVNIVNIAKVLNIIMSIQGSRAAGPILRTRKTLVPAVKMSVLIRKVGIKYYIDSTMHKNIKDELEKSKKGFESISKDLMPFRGGFLNLYNVRAFDYSSRIAALEPKVKTSIKHFLNACVHMVNTQSGILLSDTFKGLSTNVGKLGEFDINAIKRSMSRIGAGTRSLDDIKIR